MAQRWIPRLCAAVFVAGIAGIIVTSIVSNNNGVVLVLGGCIALAAVALMVHAAVTHRQRIDVFDDARAEQVERLIDSLVAEGADEARLRDLVREAIRLGQT